MSPTAPSCTRVNVCVFVSFACPWQGATRADDLSSDDMKRPGFVCHIELSTFLLALGVRSKRTRPRRTRNGGAPPRSSPRLVVLLSQLRRMNQASNPKPGLLLRARTDKNKKQVSGSLCEGIFKVHAPLRSKASVAIQLDRRVTAKDVTARFSCDNSLSNFGGNIGERRLRPDCLPLDVYHANPGCHWLVKPRGDDRRRRRRPSHVDQRLCS
uniref:RHG40/28/18 C-terminal ubiquitin-like domain-containing protein n=1 Tax=Hippocampus comes TaxID=109280 RepID=A0A3Q3D988_HIPCM